MKKILALVLATVLLLTCLSACGKKGVTMADIEKAGELVVATSPDFPPFENLEGEEVVGIEIDVLELICKELGVELKLEQMDFDSVLAGVQAGKYDMGASGISVTPEREKNMLFTAPYCLAAQAIVVKDGSAIQTKADLAGKTVSVQTGTTAESFCLENGYDVKPFAANSDAQTALTTGKVDAWVIDDLTAAEMVEAYNAENEEKLFVLDEAMTTEPYAFAFAQGSEEVVEKVSEILNKLVKDGTIQKIFEEHNAPYTAPEV
ncbi:MAG: amino acid ABC transporter substrate-binding protein [Ruminococcaceae bacterium]|nr:amino acid ABC transporter substrate-binding protein [Oscillospiraceae bacterium]